MTLMNEKSELLEHVSLPPGQTNSLVDIKTHREALSQATEAVSILTIHRVNVTDTGLYCCNVTSIGTRQSQQTQVIVYGKNPSCVFFFCSEERRPRRPLCVCLGAATGLRWARCRRSALCWSPSRICEGICKPTINLYMTRAA